MDHLQVVCQCCTGDMHVPGKLCVVYQRTATRVRRRVFEKAPMQRVTY
jgi:hypothetical protein